MSANGQKLSNLEAWDVPPTFHGFKGGDLWGVVEHLDYLHDLGVTALYFTPIFQSAANHRYHTHDYFQVDPLLGGNAALRALLDEAHRRSMKVVLDGVFNHASRGFFQFNHILENGKQSPYLDWFSVNSWPLHAYEPENAPPGYAAWWGLKALPKFNTTTPAVRQFLWEVARHWIAFGADGWRLDVPNEINDDEFWREFRRVVKQANPEAYIVGEIWHGAERWLQGDQFDAVMNYQFTRACIEFFIGAGGDEALWEGGYGKPQPRNAQGFAQAIEALLRQYPEPATLAMLNLLDSHDTPRFLSMARGDEAALRLATLFQMTYPGAPSIYYGDEVGMMGGRDPDSRRGMIWRREWWNQSLFAYVKQCIRLRKEQPALRHGAFKTLHAEDMLYACERRLGEQVCIVIFNAGHTLRTFDLGLADSDSAKYIEAWGAGEVTAQQGRLRGLTVPARTGIVFLKSR